MGHKNGRRAHQAHGKAAKRAGGGKRKRNLVILLIETLVLVVMVVALRTVIIPMTKMGTVSLNDEALRKEMNEGVLENEMLKGYTTIALFGVDSREGALSQATLSDVVIICAINDKTGEIRLCSVYRDTFLNVGDYYTKCNAAYSWGGPEQAITMLNKNMDLNITDFATIGFQGLTDVIDELGGVEVDVDEEAVIHLNNYQWKMAQEMNGFANLEDAVAGVHYTPLEHGGMQTLNGLQATAYCRVRYLAGGDLTRAQHQREVLQAAFDKAKKNPLKVPVIAEKLFNEVYTSYDMAEVISLASGVLKYDMGGQTGFPNPEMLAMGMIGSEGSCIVPVTLETNVSWLHAFLYGSENYRVSPTVSEYSSRIQSETAPYLQ
ncbi:MAG: LCP family protein [Lachnospiraceae bacterium]|nr:LCP family protein [Lachnospiraceae bacterium]